MKGMALLTGLVLIGCGGAGTPAPVLRTMDAEAAGGLEALTSETTMATGDALTVDHGKDHSKDVGPGDMGKEQSGPEAIAAAEGQAPEPGQEVIDAAEPETEVVALDTVQCSPVPEICNGLDDDCDGQTDEDLGWITCGVGACATVVNACEDGVPQQCIPKPPGTEVCNGLDDDCDGETDDGLAPLTCGIGPCFNTVPACVGGIPQVCNPLPPKKEVCNGLDDNCDGLADNMDACPCPVFWRQDRPYFFCTAKAKWMVARDVCQSYDYHLVTISDADENTWVVETARSISDSPWWTGLNDIEKEGHWVWENGEPVVFSAWQQGEPNDWWGEDCMEVGAYKKPLWNDVDCGVLLNFVCEFGQ